MFEIIEFKSKWKTPLGLNKATWIWKNKIKDLDLINTKNFLLEKEKEILKLPSEHDGLTHLPDGITARSNQFNLFNFNLFIVFIYIICWCTILVCALCYTNAIHLPLLEPCS